LIKIILMDERTKKILEQEKDPKVLRGLIDYILKDNDRLRGVIKEIEDRKANESQMQMNLEEQVKLLRRQIYARKKEDRTKASDRPRDKSQEEALLFSQSAFPASETRDENQTLKTRWENLEKVEIIYELTTDELKSESERRGISEPRAEQWEEIKNSFDTSTKIQIVERSYVKEIHKKKKYKLKSEFNVDTEKDSIITADGADELLPGMNYTTEFLASVVADKFISHMPLERQLREMESLGLKGMRNSTLSRLAALGAASLEPLQEKILKEDLITSDLSLHIDETPWKIQNKDEKDGYMWVISNKYGSYYFFKPTRSAKVISEKLYGYTGPVLTDGLESYVGVLDEAKIPHAFCWAHARRYFIPLEGHDPGVKPILDEIDELFSIERKAKDFLELKKLRQDESQKVADKLKKLLLEEYPKSRDGSQKRKAILYITNRWEGFTKFITDTRIPLSNNEAERTIRHAVVGRKNYYGSGNQSGAETAATLFTVIESCKKNDVDPRTFLIMSLQAAARGEELVTPLTYARRTRSNSQPA